MTQLGCEMTKVMKNIMDCTSDNDSVRNRFFMNA